VKGIEQIVGDIHGAKPGNQCRRSVANPGHGFGRGLHTLVDHVKKPLRAALLFAVRGLRHNRSGLEQTINSGPEKGANSRRDTRLASPPRGVVPANRDRSRWKTTSQ
jgi:hypothetical protein